MHKEFLFTELSAAAAQNLIGGCDGCDGTNYGQAKKNDDTIVNPSKFYLGENYGQSEKACNPSKAY